MSTSTKQAPQDESPALQAWKAKNEKLSEIEIQKTLEALGALPNQDRDKNKWKIIGIGNILTKKQAWKNGNLEVSGYGSVSLVKHALGFDKDTEAMNWLAERFPEELEGEWREEIQKRLAEKSKKTPGEDEDESGFEAPEREDSQLDKVLDYLIGRGLPASLVEREIQSGRLYATKQKSMFADKPQKRKTDGEVEDEYGDVRCVFIGPASAEIRSVDPKGFKGCAKGSDTEKSGYQVMFQAPHEPVLAITEAAVDALSYHVLHPHRFTISTNGAGRFELQFKLTMEAHRNGFQTLWAFDADVAGDLAAQRLFNSLYLREKLSDLFSVTPEEIDEWMLHHKLVSLPEHSPHELFLSKERGVDLPIYKAERDDSDPENPKVKHTDTGETSPPLIRWKFLKMAGAQKRGTSGEFKPTPDDIARIEKKYGVHYERPQGLKDWNEILSTTDLGRQAAVSYEKNFGKKVLVTPPVEQKNADTKQSQTQQVIAPPKPTGRFVRKPVTKVGSDPVQSFAQNTPNPPKLR